MAAGGCFGADDIPHFDGGLFADDEVLELDADDLEMLARRQRAGLGEHRAGDLRHALRAQPGPGQAVAAGRPLHQPEDILLIVEPVLMAPLRRRVGGGAGRRREALAGRSGTPPRGRSATAARTASCSGCSLGFAGRLAGVRVLDPACGSGNFLYVALKQLLDLEKEVVTFAAGELR